MASCNEIRRRSSAADRNPLDGAALASPPPMATTTTFSPTPDAIASPPVQPTTSKQNSGVGLGLSRGSISDNDSQAMPPPPRPFGELGSPPDPLSPSRRRFAHSRAHSTASVTRQANRLSLTLPIAPQRSEISRPQPFAPAPVADAASKPPTPAQTPVLAPLEDANDFIIAIAAQERKVLELREELARAEADLTSLKKKWTAKESMQKRTVEIKSMDSPRPTDTPDGATSPARRSVDLDRKKLLLQSQNNTPTTPTQGRRRVIRGGHTRTLSLLSPARPGTGFPVHEDNSIDSVLQQQQERLPPQVHTPTLSKRATWQPRTQPPSSGVPQIVEDFRLGIRAFVEDIRQITVGDEPVSGELSPRSTATPTRSASSRNHSLDDRTVTRSKVSPAFDSVTAGTSEPQRSNDALTDPERAKTARGKHFSWTPLGIDTVDDNDWESWESPPTSKSSRWSGSTIHGAGLDDIHAIPETVDEATTSL